MNILILSAGTRDKVVQYFKKELAGKGRVIATDCSNLAPAVYEADAFSLVPRIMSLISNQALRLLLVVIKC